MDFRPIVRRYLSTRSDAGRLPDPDLPIVEELAQHLADLYQEAIESGLDHEAALARAVEALPDRADTLTHEIASATRTLRSTIEDGLSDRHDESFRRRSPVLADFARDLRYAVRMF